MRLVNNKSTQRVAINYFFMVFLQFLNSAFAILIYPLIINKLGAESYGFYLFYLSIISYFTMLVNFGFDLPSLNKLSKIANDKTEKSTLFSEVFSVKLLLFIGSTIIFSFMVLIVDSFRENAKIIFIIYLQVISSILIQNWFFQGIQKMGVITIIQIITKALTIPFIIYLVNTSNDLFEFSLIMSLSSLLGGVLALIYIVKRLEIKLTLNSRKNLEHTFKSAIPFFWSSSSGLFKSQGVNTLIGSFSGMVELSIFDLANKILILPQALVMNMNNAIFPELMKRETISKKFLIKILTVEVLISLMFICLIIFIGQPLVFYLGGEKMIKSYYVAIIMSLTLVSWVIVGCFTFFILLPNGMSNVILKNQIWSVTVFFIVSLIGLLIVGDVYVIAASLVISTIAEVIYCIYILNKHKLIK